MNPYASAVNSNKPRNPRRISLKKRRRMFWERYLKYGVAYPDLLRVRKLVTKS